MEIINIFKKSAFWLLKALLVILILLLLLWAVLWFIARPANKFCNNLSATDKYENVISKARALGYRTYDFKRDKGLVVKISTQDSPFFRMACVVTFSNDAIIKKEVIADD